MIGHGVARVTNGGTSYTFDVVDASGEGYSIALSPINSSKVYSGGSNGLWVKDYTGSDSWVSIFSKGSVNKIHFSGSKIYINSDAGIYFSDTTTIDWFLLGTDVATTIAVNRYDPNILYKAIGSDVFSSTDAGLSWKDDSDALPVNNPIITLALSNNGYLFAGTENLGVYRLEIPVTGVISSNQKTANNLQVISSSNSIIFNLIPTNSSKIDITIFNIAGRALYK